MSSPRILLWDIETTDLEAEMGRLLVFGYKWLDEKKPYVMSLADVTDPCEKCHRFEIEDKDLVLASAEILRQADIWVTWYGKAHGHGFDLRFMQSRLMKATKVPSKRVLPDTPHVDGWEIAKRNLKLRSNRLDSVQRFLELPDTKTRLEPQVWARAQNGDPKALKYIVEHCRKDVLVLEQAYTNLRGLHHNKHPNLALWAEEGIVCCPTCGSTKLRKNGIDITRVASRQRWKCFVCGAECHSRRALRGADTR